MGKKSKKSKKGNRSKKVDSSLEISKLVKELAKEKSSTTPEARSLRRRLRKLGHFISKLNNDTSKAKSKKKTKPRPAARDDDDDDDE